MPKVSFKTLPVGDQSPDFLDKLTVFVEYAASQSADSRGIAFSLIFENASANDIELLNPYDLITYTLTDEAGWPIGLDAPASRLVANSPAFVSQKGDYLKVTNIVSGESPKDIEAEVKAENTVIPHNSAYTYMLQIDNMIPHSEDGKAGVKTGLGKGKHGLTLTLPLISFVANKEYSRTTQSPNIEINRT